jgi:PKD repeat protein
VTATPAAASGFVEANGVSFSLNGAPWRPIGFNQYRLTSAPGGYVCDGGYGAISDASLGQRLDEMKAAGANVVRTWFFQSYFDGGGWRPFDRLLTAAASRGMTVIPVLVNQFADCEPASIEKNIGFYDYAFRSPGFGYGRSFKDYAQMVAAHYADNRTIAFWQLVNEAEAQYQGCPPNAATVLRSFAGEMRAALRSVDPNHLVSLGTIGSGQCGASYLEYKYVHEAVDICEVHDYGSPQSAMPGDAFNGIALRIEQCKELGKPIFVGEAGIRADVGPDGSATGAVTQSTLETRARFFKAKIAQQFAAGMNGYLIWEKLLENSDSSFNLAGERFGVGRLGVGAAEDPLVQVMRDAAPRPSPAISSGPTGQTSSPTPTFTFASGDPTATFECRLDGAAFARCVSPYTTPPLALGAHTFEVRAVNSAAATDPTFARRTFTVDEPPTAAYTPSTYAAVLGQTVSFDGRASSDPDGSIVSYRWVWGDGTPDGSGATATHAFRTTGRRSVGLYVTDADGQTAAVGHGLTVGDEPPAAAYTPSAYSPRLGQTVSFDGRASSDPDGSIVSYRWVWGDGTPDGSGPTASHAFTTTGLRSVGLYVTDSDGQTAAAGHGITVG